MAHQSKSLFYFSVSRRDNHIVACSRQSRPHRRDEPSSPLEELEQEAGVPAPREEGLSALCRPVHLDNLRGSRHRWVQANHTAVWPAMGASCTLANSNTTPCRARETQVEKSNVFRRKRARKRWISQPMARRGSATPKAPYAGRQGDANGPLQDNRAEKCLVRHKRRSRPVANTPPQHKAVPSAKSELPPFLDTKKGDSFVYGPHAQARRRYEETGGHPLCRGVGRETRRAPRHAAGKRETTAAHIPFSRNESLLRMGSSHTGYSRETKCSAARAARRPCVHGESPARTRLTDFPLRGGMRQGPAHVLLISSCQDENGASRTRCEKRPARHRREKAQAMSTV